MRISAKADYAVRAAVELAGAPDEKPVKAERIATAQDIPLNFLENILGELRHAGIVRSHRGADGGFRLAKPADQADDRRHHPRRRGTAGQRPRRPARGDRPTRDRRQRFRVCGSRSGRTCARSSSTSRVADVASGKLPTAIDKLAEDPEAWVTR